VSEYEIYTKQLGIPALSVLRWATKNGARAMGLADELGTIAAGKLADLLVVDGDPSADIGVLRTGIQIVMKDGQIVRDRLAG
jgi:imidazolonepropionase-like amidohydrolase